MRRSRCSSYVAEDMIQAAVAWTMPPRLKLGVWRGPCMHNDFTATMLLVVFVSVASPPPDYHTQQDPRGESSAR